MTVYATALINGAILPFIDTRAVLRLCRVRYRA